MVFIISYDLCKPTQRYEELIEAIKHYPRWACLGGSAYLIETEQSHVEVRDNLGHYIDGNDKLFVGRVSAPAAWNGMANEVSEWIKNRLNE